MSSESEDKKPNPIEGDTVYMSRIGASVLASISTFGGETGEQAKRFMTDFEEALDLANISVDKFKKFHFKSKLRGLPAEWYETTRDDESFTTWESVKKAFIHQFDKAALRPKDVIMKLMNIRQDVEKDESIQSLSIRITQLFNEYKQTMGKSLSVQEKIEYFIEALFPSYKEQLNNQYQSADGAGYPKCTWEEVLATALKLERNARAYEEDVQQLPAAVTHLKINAVHKAANPVAVPQAAGKVDLKLKKQTGDLTKGIEKQNAEDIKKIQEEQQGVKDQLSAVSTALQDFGEQMRTMKVSIENLHLKRMDGPGVANPMYNHRFKGGPYNQNESRNTYQRKFADPRSYNAPRTNDGQLQGSCYKCGKKGHYANACRMQVQDGKENSHQIQGQSSSTIPVHNRHHQTQDQRQLHGNTTNAGRPVQNNGSNPGPFTRSMTSSANHVSIINHTAHPINDNALLLIMKGQIGSTKLTDIVFDNGAAVSCLNASIFHRLEPMFKSRLTRCSKDKQLTNATGGVMTLLGELYLDIELEGPDQPILFQNIKVVVVQNLQSEMLFGADVMPETDFLSYTVHLKNHFISFEHFNHRQSKVNFSFCGHEPEEEWKQKPIPVYLSKEIRIPAQSSILCQGLPRHCTGAPGNVQQMMFTGVDDSLGVEIHSEDTLVVLENSGDYGKPSFIPIILTNVGDRPYTVKADTAVGLCQELTLVAAVDYDLENHSKSIAVETVNNVNFQTTDPNYEYKSGVKNIEQYDFSKVEAVDEAAKKNLRALLLNYSHVFSERPFGSEATGLMEHTIELTDPMVKPIKHYGYRVAPAVASALQENVELMRKLGVIEESQSPWASPVLLVPKKDGSRRFCTDFRALNSVTKSDVFPLPRIDDILDKLGSCQYFTSIDLKHAFWQIPMREIDKEKTAFICGNRLWQYRRMAFGLKNSPATFQRCISTAIGENEYSLAYLDDIIIFDKTVEDHLIHIEAILKRLAKHNLNAKINKCEFFKTSLTFLGHVVSRSGISVCPDKVTAVREFPVPTNLML